MPYVTGGAAFGDIKTSVGGLDNRETRTGWTAGGGLEAAIAGPWTAKIEYLHVDLGNAATAVPRRDRELPHRHRARRHQLPVLTGRLTRRGTKQSPGVRSGAFACVRNQTVTLVAANDGTWAANLSCQATRRG